MKRKKEQDLPTTRLVRNEEWASLRGRQDKRENGCFATRERKGKSNEVESVCARMTIEPRCAVATMRKRHYGGVA